MNPENENEQVEGGGEEQSAVIIDLSKKVDEQEKPIVASEETTTDDADKPLNGSPGTDDEDEFVTTGRKDFDKRLKREIRNKIASRAETAAERQLRESAEARAADLEAQNETLRRQLEAAPSPAANTADLDTKIADARTKLAKALEDGESNTAAALQVELGDLTGQRAVRVAAPKQAIPPKPAPKAPVKGGITPTGQAFVTANAAWWNDPAKAPIRSAIVAIDAQLLAERSDPNTEQHYRLIAKRAKAMGIKVDLRQPFAEDQEVGDEIDLNDKPATNRNRAPMGGNGNGGGNGNSDVRNARAGKIVLNDKDRETMRTFKLDPSNPAHLRAFAKARQERLMSGESA